MPPSSLSGSRGESPRQSSRLCRIPIPGSGRGHPFLPGPGGDLPHPRATQNDRLRSSAESGQTVNQLTPGPRRPDAWSLRPLTFPPLVQNGTREPPWMDLEQTSEGTMQLGRRGPCQVLCSWEPFQLSQGRSVKATPALRLNSYLGKKKAPSLGPGTSLLMTVGTQGPADLSCLAREQRGKDQGRERRPHLGSPGGRRRQEEAGRRGDQLQMASSCSVLSAT